MKKEVVHLDFIWAKEGLTIKSTAEQYQEDLQNGINRMYLGQVNWRR